MGSFVEAVDLDELIVRDGGICGICGDPVDMTVRYPHPFSPSIDHKIPVSLEGEHSMENCQLAHLICNSRRVNKPLDRRPNHA